MNMQVRELIVCFFFFQVDWNLFVKYIKLGFCVDIKVLVNGDIICDGIKVFNSELFLFGVLDYDF